MYSQCYRKRFTDKTYSKDNQTLMLSEEKAKNAIFKS